MRNSNLNPHYLYSRRVNRLTYVLSIASIALLSLCFAATSRAANVSWVLDFDGSWNTPANWSTNAFPGVLDDVIIDRPGTLTVTLSGGIQSIHSIFSNENITFSSGGSLSLEADSVINGALNMGSFSSSAQISGAGNLTLSGPVIWTVGSMTGAGKTTLASTSTTFLAGTSTSSLSISRTIDNLGVVTFQNSPNSPTFNNFQFSNGGIFNNLAGGVFNFNYGNITSSGSGNVFNNSGTFIKSVYNPTATSVAVPFNNLATGVMELQEGVLSLGTATNAGTINVGSSADFSATSLQNTGTINYRGTEIFNAVLDNKSSGVINVLSGILSLQSSVASTNAGTINVAEGAIFTIINGNYSHLAGSKIAGAGGVSFGGGVNNYAGSMEATGPISLFGTVNFNANQTFNGNLTLSGGTMGGTGDIEISGPFAWSNGTMGGTGKTTLSANSITTFTGNGNISRVVDNNGVINVTNSFSVGTGGTFNNIGTLNFTGTGGVTANGGVFNNVGIVNKVGNSNPSSIGVRFNNSATGVINLTSGTATFTSGLSTNAGIINVGSGVTFALDTGITHLAGSSIKGSGGVSISNSISSFVGSLEVTGPITVSHGFALEANQTLAGPVTMNNTNTDIRGSGNVTIANSLTWTSGRLSGTGLFTTAPSTTTTYNPTSSSGTLAKAFENNGVFNHNSTTTLQFNTGAAFTNNGTLNFLNTGSFSNSSPTDFTNAGTINKLNANSVTLNAVTNSSTGHINVQAGTLTIGNGSAAIGSNAGAIDVASGATFTIANGSDFTQLTDSSITGAGTVNLNSTITNFSGKLNSTGPINLAGAVTFNTDQTIAGTLSAASVSAWIKGPGNLTFTNRVLWNNSATMQGTGKIVVDTNASFALSNSLNLNQLFENKGLFTQNGGTLFLNTLGTVDNKGTFKSVGTSSINASLATNSFNNFGTFEKSTTQSATTLTMGVPFVNKPTGVVNVLGGTLNFLSQATNEGTINISASSVLTVNGGRLLNQGTINLNGANPSPTAHVIDNSATGVINILSNSVSIGGSSFTATRGNAGIINLAPNTHLVMNNDYEQLAGSSIQGAGSVTISARQTNFAGLLQATGIITISNDVTFNANQRILGMTTLGDFTSNIPAISGTGDVTFANSVTINRLKMSGTGKTIIDQGVIASLGPTTQTISRVFQNNGIMSMSTQSSSNRITLSGGTLINNGTFNAYGTIDTLTGTNVFENNGTLNALTLSSTGLTISAPFNNTGTVNVIGRFSTTGGGTNTGTMNVEGSNNPNQPNMQLFNLGSSFVNSGKIVLNGSQWINSINSSATGQVKLTSGATTFQGNGNNSGNIDIAAGSSADFSIAPNIFTETATITGAGSAAFGTVSNFSGKILSTGLTIFAGQITINSNQTFAGAVRLSQNPTIDGPGNLNMNTSLLWNGGSMIGAGKTTLGVNATASFTYQIPPTAPVTLGRVFDNLGTMNFDRGNLIFNFSDGTLNNIGTFNASVTASLANTAGTNLFNNTGTFNKSNSNTITFVEVPFSNTGTVNVQGGTLSFFGPVVQMPSNTLTGGTWNVTNNSTLSFFPTVINAIGMNANVLISGIGSTINGFDPISNAGQFTLASGKQFTVPQSFTNDGTVTIGDTASLTIGALLHSPDKGTVNVSLGGTLTANNLHAHALNLNGKATVLENGTSAGASKVETLAMGSQAVLNLKNNDLVVGTGNLATVRSLIKTGTVAIPASLSTGITSDLPEFKVTTGFGYALGNDTNLSPLLGGVLSGESYDENSVLVKYTLLGDADLDGDTDLNDLGLWAQSFTGDLGGSGSPITFWTSGDFDYDGDTDLNDLGFWAGTFTGDLGGGSGSLIVVAPGAPAAAISALNGMGITVVPEPGSLFLATAGLLGLIMAARKYK